MMQYIGDLAYLFNIYVNVSTFIQSSSRIQDTTLSRLFAAYFWFFFFFFFCGNFGWGGGGGEMSPTRVTGPVVRLGSLSWVWGHVVGSGKILACLCCSDPNGVVVRAIKLWLKNLHEGVSMAPSLFQLKCWFLSGWVPLW